MTALELLEDLTGKGFTEAQIRQALRGKCFSKTITEDLPTRAEKRIAREHLTDAFVDLMLHYPRTPERDRRMKAIVAKQKAWQ